MQIEDIVRPRRRIFLMRHGSVTYFDLSGARIDPRLVPLNEAGRQQATTAGLAFTQLAAHFDRVIVSGLPRTVETAVRVLSETRQHIELEIWPELEELRGGPIEEIPDEQLRDAFLGAWEGTVAPERRFLGGESIGELLERVNGAIDRLRADPSWDTVLMVLHGGVNRAIMSRALSGKPLFFGNISQAPGCINALDVGDAPDDWVVRFTALSPTDLLQAGSRRTTLEAMLGEYLKTRKA